LQIDGPEVCPARIKADQRGDFSSMTARCTDAARSRSESGSIERIEDEVAAGRREIVIAGVVTIGLKKVLIGSTSNFRSILAHR